MHCMNMLLIHYISKNSHVVSNNMLCNSVRDHALNNRARVHQEIFVLTFMAYGPICIAIFDPWRLLYTPPDYVIKLDC